MSNVSKLVIKACSDNKFSSFTGEFITSINPENVVIKSAVSYHVPGGMPSAHLLKYCGSPPSLLSFSLLFDNTGIIPGSNAIAVMEQVKQLQDVTYNVHKKNNAPNYIRIIWGQIDFKGRLVDLDIVYSMFQVDGTLVRAEARIAVLEELVTLGTGKSAAGVDSNYAKASGAHATVHRTTLNQGTSSDAVFAPTPNGMNGAYSGAPDGAYSGGPDDIYHGSNGASGPVYGSSMGHAGNPAASVDKGSAAASYSDGVNADHAESSFKGGVAGNGPGGSGGGIGGGGHGPAIEAGSSGGGAVLSGTGSPASRSGTSSNSRVAGGGPASAAKSNAVPVLGSGPAKGKSGMAKMGASLAAGTVAAGGVAAAVAANAPDSLRKLSALKANVNLMKNKVSFLRRLKNFAKKVAPRAYDAGKKVVKSSGF